MDHAVNVVISPESSNSSVAATRCHHCGVIPRPLRRRKPADCGPVELKLSYRAATRLQLMRLLEDSELPQSEFAAYVLGVDGATIWRYLNGSVIPHSKAVYLHHIETIRRMDGFVHISVRTRSNHFRWNNTLVRRERQIAMATGSEGVAYAG